MSVFDVEAQADAVFETIAGGGIAVIPLDVAYAVMGHSGDSIRRIFAAKERSLEKPNGMFGSFDIMREVHVTGQREQDVVRAVTEDFGLPFSIVAPFRADHPFFAGTDAAALERSTKAGTLDMLMNAGSLQSALARRSLDRSMPILGSSANRSLTGSKFRLEDVDAEVRAVADIEIDHGLCRYANPEGISSTIVDLQDFTVLRYGCCYAQIRDILQRWFRIELPEKP